MLESITRKSQYNHYYKRSLQCSGDRHLNVRSAFMFYAAALLLIASSPYSNAEDGKKTSAEIGQSSQSESARQNQAAEKKVAKPKTKCMPRQPCSDTLSPL
jgi:hypothetical protein